MTETTVLATRLQPQEVGMRIHTDLLAAVAALMSLLPASASARPAEGTVTLRNAHTRETLRVPAGTLPSPRKLNGLLRCHVDKRYTLMDPRLVAAAIEAANHFHARTVDIVSAFRTGRRNSAMRQAGHSVARRSRHVHGQALDLRLPGVRVSELCDHFDRTHRGGVGCYPELRFVHIDVGPDRRWRE